MQDEKTVSGKKFVILLFLFFVVFTLVGLSCTYWVGQSTAPYFKKKFEEQQRAEQATPSAQRR